MPDNKSIVVLSENNSSADLLSSAKKCGEFVVHTATDASKEFVSGAVDSAKDSVPSVVKKSLHKIVTEGEPLEDVLSSAGQSVADTAIKKGSEKAADVVENASKKVIDDIRINTNTLIIENIGDNAGGRILSSTVDSVCDEAYGIMMNSLEKLFVEGESLEDTLQYAGGELAETAVKKSSELLLDELKTSAEKFFKDSNNPVLKSITEQNAIGRLVTLASAVGGSVVKYVNGEITAEELEDDILMQGLTIGVSSLISIACPIPFVGQAIANFALKYAEVIFDTQAHINDYLLKEEVIRKLEHKAIAEMKQKREEFHRMVEESLDEWDSTVDEAFSQIINSSFDDSFSLDGIVSGLDKILSLCDEKARFHSLDEWEEQLDMPLNLSF